MNTSQVKIGILRTGITCALVVLFACCRIETPETDFEWHIRDNEATVVKYTGKSPNVVIPRSAQGYPVTGVGKEAFKDCGLTSVDIPDGVWSIGESAFADNKLNSVLFPSTLIDIGSYAFSGNDLHEITLPQNTRVILSNAFRGNNLSSVTIPKELHIIKVFAFADNPIREVTIERDYLYRERDFFELGPYHVFHPELPAFLSKGTYILGDDGWVVQKPDNTLTSIQLHTEEFGKNKPDLLTKLLAEAIRENDVVMVRNCVSWGVDVNNWVGIRGRDGYNTPLAHAIYGSGGYRWDPPRNLDAEIIEILLEAGAIAQYWMLSFSYFRPDITKLFLEHGALTNPELAEYGIPTAISFPDPYTRPASILTHYIAQKGTNDTNSNRAVAESIALLLEYGADAKYMDPTTGETPLSLALHWSHYSPEFTEFLLKHIKRPLSLEEYRLIISLNREEIYQYGWLYESGKEHKDKRGYDALVLQDIRGGLLNPALKDKDGRDIFDYAAATGTAKLMQGLMPYLARSGRTVLAPNYTGLYIDAIHAENFAVAAVLSTAMNNAFAMTDAQGRGYSLEFYNYDRETIYRRAQEILDYSLYQTGPGGTRRISEDSGNILFWPNTFYVINRYNVSLHTVGGLHLNLNEIINAELEQYYLEKEKEQPNNADWYITRISGNVLFANTSWWDKPEYALIDIATGTPSVYILEKESLKLTSDMGRYLLENAMDLVIESGIGYLIKSPGEVFQFTVNGRPIGARSGGARSFTFDKIVSWRDCRIPGWKSGERVFVDGETVAAYNFATGAVRPLGKKVEIAVGNESYVYENREGRRFIVEAKSARAYPEPTEEYRILTFFESGYVYADKDDCFYTVCVFEGGTLKRKLVLSGSAINRQTIYVHGNKIYIGGNSIAFTIDIRTARVNTAFRTGLYFYDSSVYAYMFPFGPDDVVYTYTVSDH